MAADARHLLDVLDEPALMVRAGRVVAANSAATALLGARIEGSDVRLAIRHPEALALIHSGRRQDRDISGIGGAERPWTVSVRPTDDNVVVVRLIDRSATRAAEKMRVDFVANASHELRTPLTTIIGYAETIAEDPDLEPEVMARFGTTIRSEAQRMLRIVEDLMSLSRIEADRFVAPTGAVDVGEVVKAATDHATAAIERRGCLIEVSIADTLPQISGDRAQLLQLCDNLISNAVRYGCGERGSTIAVSVGEERNLIQLSVRDSGPGIPAEHLPRLTERFYRVDDARSRDSGGTGLGLAIVKHIVERHRGWLDIRSTPGRGTEVTVRLPARRPWESVS